MRQHLLISALTAFSITLCAEAPIALQAPIRSVRVHPDEAWVTRTGVVRIPGAGTHRLKLTQLPGDLKSDNLRVQAKGPEGTGLGEILVGPDRYIAPETPESKLLATKLEALHQQKIQLESQQKASEKAYEFLDGTQSLARNGGTGNTSIVLPTGAALVELNRAMEGRYAELAAQSQVRAQALTKVQMEMTELEIEWQKLKGKLDTNPNPSQVTVELVTPRAGDVEMEVSYRTAQARWKPSYEARLAPNGKTMELVLFAEVTQGSGEAWNGVQMDLSNSHPSRVQEMPAFRSFPRIGWNPPPVPYRGSSATVEVIASVGHVDSTSSQTGVNFTTERSTPASYRPPEPKPLPVLEAPATSLEEAKGLAQTWHLEGPKDVPSDGDAHRFLVASENVEPHLQIVVAPRLDTTPYQLVRFAPPSRIPMFPGASILRSIGTMRMGQGSLSIPPPNQPFELSFGPYQGLRVGLQRVSEKRPFRMTKVTETRQYQKNGVRDQVKEEIIANGADRIWELREIITLANDSGEQLDVEVQDRIAASIHESVKISPTPDTTPGAQVRNPFVQAWTLNLPSKSKKTISLGLIIKAPKEGDLIGLKDLGLE
jgi:uncharacterized protein (TIGR02231 family)